MSECDANEHIHFMTMCGAFAASWMVLGRHADPCQEDMIKHLIDSSGKLQLLDRMLAKLKAAGHRVLLFSQVARVAGCRDALIACR
jgi:hypothetical protein